MGKWGFVGLLYLLWSLVAAPNSLIWRTHPIGDRLDRFQKSISKQEFLSQLNEVYCPRKSWWSPWIEIEDNQLEFVTEDWYDLQFLESNEIQ